MYSLVIRALSGYGYANKGDNGNIEYNQITSTPGQFNPGDEIYGIASDINRMGLEHGILETYGLGAVFGGAVSGGVTAYSLYNGASAVVQTLGIPTALGATAGTLVTNPDLEAWVAEMFQATDKIPGGIAGAILSEARTGIFYSPAGHFQEAAEILEHLNDFIRGGELSVSDQVVAKQLAQNLAEALSVARAWGAIK
jgi:hypothetical protein